MERERDTHAAKDTQTPFLHLFALHQTHAWLCFLGGDAGGVRLATLSGMEREGNVHHHQAIKSHITAHTIKNCFSLNH